LPWEELESALSARFKQASESNASTDGIHPKMKALYFNAHLANQQLFSFQWFDQKI
jgi:hypothetical protein